MKKLLLISFMLLVLTGITKSQVIADYEVIKMNYMAGGADDSSTLTVVPNPDPTGINTSAWVVKFVRDKNGVPWGGFWSALAASVDVTTNKYVHVKVWKPRISPIKFKLEGGAAGTLETLSITPQATTGQWEDMVFDFTSKTGTYPTIAFMPDFEDPLTLTDDIIIYFDDIMVNNDPAPNSAAAYVIEDYEIMPLNLMTNDPLVDLSYMNIVPNPDPTGINISNYVVKYFRDKDGPAWGGFWSPTPVDVTTNKYMHVKVWKPRISPLKFKIEKPGENHEIFSINPQATINGWEDIVFDFSAYSGEWTVIAFMPDFEDPLTLTEDITIYFDDIILNDSPDPIIPGVDVSLNVDIHGCGLAAGTAVYLAGDFGGVYGTWNEPGTNPANELTDPDGDSIYTLDMRLLEGAYQFKFFGGAGWDGGEWTGDPNRRMTVTAEGTFTYKWGVKPAIVTFNVDVKGSGLAGENIYVAGNFGGIYGTWNTPGDNLNDMLTAVEPLTDSIYTVTMTLDSIGSYQFKFFKGEGWDGGEWTGDPNRMVIVLGDTTFANFIWGQKFNPGMNEISLNGKIQAYPNPVKNVLNIVTTIELSKVVLTNMIGQEVERFDNVGIGRKVVNTSELPSGIFFITSYAKSGGQLTQKIVKY